MSTVGERTLEEDHPASPQTKERRNTSINHPGSMFQLFGVCCRGSKVVVMVRARIRQLVSADGPASHSDKPQ